MDNLVIRNGNDIETTWGGLRLVPWMSYSLPLEDVAYQLRHDAGDLPEGVYLAASPVGFQWADVVNYCHNHGLLNPVMDAPVEPEPEPESAEDAEPAPVEYTLDDVPYLSDSVIDALFASGIHSPRDLIGLTASDLQEYNGIGEVTGQAIVDWVSETYA